MITFPKSLTINACEEFLEKLERTKGDTLLLPVGTSAYAFGGLAAAIQAANTWARKSSTRTLQLRQSEKYNEIDELISKPHKFSAAMLAKQIAFVNDQNVDIRSKVYAAAKTAIEAQAKQKYGQHYGRLCWFAFVDHSSKGFDDNFYIDGPNMKSELRQPAQITAVIEAMVEESLMMSGGAKRLGQNTLNYLGRIFYELFINTHEHGTRGLTRSEWLKPGMRVIYTQGINMNEEGIKGFIKKQPVLSTYLNKINGITGVRRQRRFMEISIVDSGLGYCGRWLADHCCDTNQPILISDEYKTFKKCFSFRQTSTSQNNKGNGLPAVMERLTKLNAFMRIRSGRLALYRDFVTSPYQKNDTCAFSDWNSRDSAENNPSQMSPVAGVSITLLIPMEAKQ
ncbi:hypothetical protein H7F10_13305 [Acidithiobacillus sp. HP-6]|uniref:hypothetical protein n=1 Tax=unclassified Acidithiobacillus TaxID=2614800 RepID=UPI00187975DB|nr:MULTISPECIES: hypothetical protein [unclassified Acidithiobacillus]MBE7563901.1 hypothetical protein [Acidithiobacillus sp. HP-6]MBE7569059.1 hypothetical protein [Acidithiobacillus sp. HP-2]